MTTDEALANAARILAFAEAETDLAKMERLTALADVWVALAGILATSSV